MSALHHSDTLLEGYISLFYQLTPRDQEVLLDKITKPVSVKSRVSGERELRFEKIADPNGVEEARHVFGAWDDEENREDVDRMVLAIAENRQQYLTIENWTK